MIQYPHDTYRYTSHETIRILIHESRYDTYRDTSHNAMRIMILTKIKKVLTVGQQTY